MKTNRTTKKPAAGSARATIKTFADRLKAEPDNPLLALRGPEDPKAYRVFRRRVAAVQAAYDNAPPGAAVIADAVWRKLLSFRPKLNARQLRELYPDKMRLDVRVELVPKLREIEDREDREAEAADDARRAQAHKARPRARKGGAK